MKQQKTIKEFLRHQKHKIRQQKKRDKFPRHQKPQMKQQKTTQTFLRHAKGKVQQWRTTEIFHIKKTKKKEYKVYINSGMIVVKGLTHKPRYKNTGTCTDN